MFKPENEMGVIVRFSQVCESVGYTIVSIRAAFPDALIQDNRGNQYKVEFEFIASNFIGHRHDPRKCDLLICWINDLDKELPLTVWELSSPEFEPFINNIPDEEKELSFLRAENKYLRKQMEFSDNTIDMDEEFQAYNPGDYKDYVFELLNEHGIIPLTEITMLVNRDKRVNFSHNRAKSTWYKYLQIWKRENRQ